MALQTHRLTLVALGVETDRPPNGLQPRLSDGVHLRWSFARDLGFPAGGFYLYRRKHSEFFNPKLCFSADALGQQHSLGSTYSFSGGQVESREPFRVTDGVLDLSRGGVSVTALPGRPYLRAYVHLLFRERVPVEVSGYYGERLCAMAEARGRIGERVAVTVAAEMMDRIVVPAAAAGLISVCVDIPQFHGDAAADWEPVPGVAQPIALPLRSRRYLASPGREDLEYARRMARSRIRHGEPTRVIPEPERIVAAGTVSVVNLSPVVIGHGTEFDQALAGSVLTVADEAAAYAVAAVMGPDRLVLARPYRGLSRDGVEYALHRDPFGQLHDALQTLVEPGTAGEPMADRLTPQPVERRGTVSTIRGSKRVTGSAGAWHEALRGMHLHIGRPVTGTLSVANGSRRVRGSRTLFDASWVGANLEVSGSVGMYRITRIIDADDLEIDSPFSAESGSGLAYKVWDRWHYLIESASASALTVDRPIESPTAGGVPYEVRAPLVASGGTVNPPRLPALRALDLALVASVEPSMAQALGLAWVDETALPGERYDYMILSAPALGGRPAAKEALVLAVEDDLEEFDAFIVLDVGRGPAPPVPVPTGLRAFALPSSDTHGAVGLTWDIGDPPAVTSRAPVAYQLWRAELGEKEPAEPAGEQYRPAHGDPLLVPVRQRPGTRRPPRPAGWPDAPLYYVDSRLGDGWYSYLVSSVDIFGRHSEYSDPAPWWRAPGASATWYADRGSGDVVHPFAVEVRDQVPPPPPTAVEAALLDPADPHLVRDRAYEAWRASLPAGVRDTLVGLRVRWRWTSEQHRQAPDLREFRIYLEPGLMNARFGRVVSAVSTGATSLVTTDISSAEGANAFVGATLRTGARAFPIVGSGGNPVRLVVAHIGPGGEVAPSLGGCTLAIPASFANRVEVRHGSPLLTGDGSAWHEGLAGAGVRVAGDTAPYRVAAVVSARELALDRPYRGSVSGAATADIRHPLFVDYTSPARWAHRLHVTSADEDWRPAPDEPAAREYEVFLPRPEDVRALPLRQPDARDPLIYAHLGITAADDQDSQPDDPARGGLWAPRAGNESQLGARVTLHRVLRTPPEAPAAVAAAGESVWASRADALGRSFYTVRFPPREGMRVLISRADDASLFQTDFELRRSRLAPDAARDPWFPPGWDPARRRAASAALDAIRGPGDYASLSADARELLGRLPGNGGGGDIAAADWAIRSTRRDAMLAPAPAEWAPARSAAAASALSALRAPADYSSLTPDALRLLASLPGNEAAFRQLTPAGLDPDEPDPEAAGRPRWHNRLGPDDPEGATLDSALRAWTDTLDGRASARFFYRTAYVDAAHNRGPLGVSSPPVLLPDVSPPRTPVFTEAVADGPRRITLRWAANTEADLADYRLFRADDEARARDVRLMRLVQTLPASPGAPTPPAWTDTDVAPKARYSYRIVATDRAGNVSAPSRVLSAQAYDDTLPAVPPLGLERLTAEPVAVRATWSADGESRLERRVVPIGAWFPVGGWLAPGAHTVDDAPTGAGPWEYRLRVRKDTGAQAVGPPSAVLAPD